SDCIAREVESESSQLPSGVLQNRPIKSEQVDQIVPLPPPQSVPSSDKPSTGLKRKVPHKVQPTYSGDECSCAECLGDVVLKGERLEIDDEIVHDIEQTNIGREADEVAYDDQNESETESENYQYSMSPVRTPTHVPSFFSDTEESSDE